jgi:hypothetical protein
MVKEKIEDLKVKIKLLFLTATTLKFTKLVKVEEVEFKLLKEQQFKGNPIIPKLNAFMALKILLEKLNLQKEVHLRLKKSLAPRKIQLYIAL